MSAAEANRAAGSLAIARSSTADRPVPPSSNVGTGSVTIRRISGTTDWSVSEANGGRPVTNVWIVDPSAYTSDATVGGSPSSSSGAAWFSVAVTTPVVVCWPPAMRAMPKSTRRGSP